MRNGKRSIGLRLAALGLCLMLVVSAFAPLAMAQEPETEVVPAATEQTQPEETAQAEATPKAAEETDAKPEETPAPQETPQPLQVPAVQEPEQESLASDQSPLAEEELLLKVNYGDHNEYYGDGQTLIGTYFEVVLGREEKVKVVADYLTISYWMNGEEIPKGAIKGEIYDLNPGAVFQWSFPDTPESAAYWLEHLKDTKIQIKVAYAPAGGESQTITLTWEIPQSAGVIESTIPTQENPSQVVYEGDGIFRYTRPNWESYGISFNEGSVFALASQIKLEGDMAQYFTLLEGEEWKEFQLYESKLYKYPHLQKTEAFSQLRVGQTVTGTISFVDNFTGQEHSFPLTYTRTQLAEKAAWYLVKDGTLRNDSVAMLYAGTSGTIQLRLYAPNQYDLPDTTETYPISLDEIKQSVLPDWVTVKVLEDGCTLEVSYNPSSEDIGKAVPIQLESDRYQANEPGRDIIFTLLVKEASAYRLATHKNDSGLPAVFAGGYWVIPATADGTLAETKAELEESGITLDYDQKDLLCLTAPVEYYDGEQGRNLDVWAYVLFPLRPTEDSSVSFKIMKGNQILQTVPVTAYAGWAGLNIPIKSGYVIERGVEQQISFEAMKTFWLQGEDENSPWIDPSTPVVTGEPVVTGSAKENIRVLWGENLSCFGIIYLENQVKGQAVITIPTGPKPDGGTAPVKQIQVIINFGNNATSGSYILSGGAGKVNFKLVDSLEYALENGRFNFESLDVARARFVEDGPFELFFYGLYKDSMGFNGNGTFGSELVESVTFESSDSQILQVTENLEEASLKDEQNQSNQAFGARITPVGAGSCDITATITFKNPDVYGAKTATIGYTFQVVTEDMVAVEEAANAQQLQAILDKLTPSAVPTIIELVGGEYGMDLELDQKNVVLRSKDPADPAIFTGNPEYTQSPLAKQNMPRYSYIVRVNPYVPGLVLQDIVIDGGGQRSGATHTFDKSVSNIQVPVSYTLRNCVIRNCVIGVEGIHENSIYLRGCQVENCQVGVEWATCYNTRFTENIMAFLEQGVVRFCDFENNQYDCAGVSGDSTGNVVLLEESLPQNYWGVRDGAVKPGPDTVVVDAKEYTKFGESGYDEILVNPVEGKTADVYASPYYLDKAHTKMDVDLETLEVQDNTAILPLEQPQEGNDSLVITAQAFATMQENGLAVSAPIRNAEGKQFASWSIPEITDTTIETNLNLSDELSDKAQNTVDSLPESEQAKVVQEVNLSHNGQLPGRTTIRIKASDLPQGDLSQLYLYWVKEDGTIVPAEVVEVTYDEKTNEYIITVDHCSEYVITSGKLVDVSQPTPTPVPTPTPGGGSSSGGSGSSGNNPSDSGTPAATPAATPLPSATPAAAGNGGSTTRPGKNVQSGNTQQKLFSAQKVMDAFADQPQDVTLKLNGQPMVSQKAFELLMERESGVLRLEGSGYAWSFDRKDLTDTKLPEGVFDTSVIRQLDEAIMEQIRSHTGEGTMTALETGFSGQLPGAAVLELRVDPDTFGNTRCGLFYLPQEGDPERIATVEVDGEGLVKLPLEHCSVYYLVVEEQLEGTAGEPVETLPNPEIPESQPTQTQSGSVIPFIAGGAVILILAVAAVTIFRRRTRD